MEIWKTWVEDDRWEVSNKGRVRLADTGLIRKLQLKEDGRYQIRLGGGSMTRRVHRMVMMTFCPIPECETMEVNHINMITSDNRLENLEWCTGVENIEMATAVMHWQRPLGPRNSPVAKRLMVEGKLISLEANLSYALSLLDKMNAI